MTLLTKEFVGLTRRFLGQAVDFRRYQVSRSVKTAASRAVAERVHLKQTAKVEKAVTNSVAPMFERQVRSAADRLKLLGESKSVKSILDSARSLTNLIYDPNEWNKELVDRALPPLAKGMAEAMKSQMILMGVDPKKDSTASDWLDHNPDQDLAEVVFDTPQGPVSMRIATEFPQSMKIEIEARLRETFAQDYWEGINQTTSGDIERVLQAGLRDGKSILQMAKEMVPSLGAEDYALNRAIAIARTEAGHALNGGRVASIDSFIEETALQTIVKKVWLSVLGNTTRDTHASLHGVPADKDGLWSLGGVRVRWPADINLPAGERINCLCTVVIEFGMTDSEAQELILESEERQLQAERSFALAG